VTFPETFGVALDRDTAVYDAGRTLLGGSPLRLVRLSEGGAAAVGRWRTGGRPASPAERALAGRLVDAGLAHPVPPAVVVADVTVVVPVRDRADDLAACLAALGGEVPVLVVDDGSVDAAPVRRLAAEHGAALLRRERPGGPAAARNAGWDACTTAYVAFVDSDCRPAPGWLAPLLAHLADPDVHAVAPRIIDAPGDGWLAAFEAARSPLDLRDRAAGVRQGSRVPYVPAAALVVRRDCPLRFDESMPVGEDVDLVWRLAAGGGRVRYEPASRVAHRHRTRPVPLLHRRFDYGTSAAPLAARHPGRLPAVSLNAWSVAAWSLLLARRPVLAGVVTGVAAARLAHRLEGRTASPYAVSVRLAGRGTLGAGRLLAAATTRTWLPVAGAAAVRSRRIRTALAAAVTVPALLQWLDRRPALDPVRWTAASLLDDAAYCAGVWAGCARERTLDPLLPSWRPAEESEIHG